MEAEIGSKMEEHIQTVRSRSRQSCAKDGDQERLAALVADFAKAAINGCSCTHFDYRTGKRTPATYQINRGITHLNIKDSSAGRRSFFKRKGVGVEIPLVSVVDVDAFDDCSACLESRALKALSPEDKERFLMVFYECDSRKANRTLIIPLILDSVSSRDTF